MPPTDSNTPDTNAAPASSGGRLKSLLSKRQLKALLIVLVVAAIAAGAYFAFSGEGTKQARKLSDEFMAAMQAKDAGRAYKIADEEFKTATTEEQLKDIFDRIAPILNGKTNLSKEKVSTDKDKYEGQMAVYVYSVEGAEDKTYYVKVQVQKDGDGWQVFNFRSSETALDPTVE